jgi:hypothetical protein
MPTHRITVHHSVVFDPDERPTFTNYAGRRVLVRCLKWYSPEPWSVTMLGVYLKKDGAPGAQTADTTCFGPEKWQAQPELASIIEAFSSEVDSRSGEQP